MAVMSKSEYKNYPDHYPGTDHLQTLRLCKNFAQTFRQPLYQIARSAEYLSQQQDESAAELAQQMTILSDQLIRLVDSYMLGLELQLADQSITLQSASLAALFTDVAHQLYGTAALHRCDVEVVVSGKFEPVMVHAEGLRQAMMNLGQTLIEAQSHNPDKSKRPVVHLAVHRTGKGIVGGVFSEAHGLSAVNLRRGRQLFGRAHQPLNQLINNPAANVFIADILLASMSGGLRAARYKKMQGLAATFAPSQQLALIA